MRAGWDGMIWNDLHCVAFVFMVLRSWSCRLWNMMQHLELFLLLLFSYSCLFLSVCLSVSLPPRSIQGILRCRSKQNARTLARRCSWSDAGCCIAMPGGCFINPSFLRTSSYQRLRRQRRLSLAILLSHRRRQRHFLHQVISYRTSVVVVGQQRTCPELVFIQGVRRLPRSTSCSPVCGSWPSSRRCGQRTSHPRTRGAVRSAAG
jgi:hypothetical protein